MSALPGDPKATAAVPSLSRLSASISNRKRPCTPASLNRAMTETRYEEENAYPGKVGIYRTSDCGGPAHRFNLRDDVPKLIRFGDKSALWARRNVFSFVRGGRGKQKRDVGMVLIQPVCQRVPGRSAWHVDVRKDYVDVSTQLEDADGIGHIGRLDDGVSALS
jgi:hypothetical protein